MRHTSALTAVCLSGLCAIGSAGEASWGLRWEPHSLVLIQRGGHYGRVIRLRDSGLLCVYSRRGQVHCRHSSDNGRTWGGEIRVTDYAHGAATNAEAIQLGSGEIVVTYNGRPGDNTHHYIIGVVRSRDDGRTWSRRQVLYEAGTTFQTGCWEPAFLSLPNGELHIYFANEAPYPRAPDQEISMLRSPDGGTTWQPPVTISHRAGHRDGMPVPLLLRDRETIVVAIEDNGLRGRMKPVLLHSTVSANWSNAPISGASTDRRDPLAPPLPRQLYAGAPYLCQTTAGHTVLAFQRREGDRPQDDWSATYAVACVGDAAARQFGSLTEPFATFGNPRSIWNSLFAKGPDTVTLVSSAEINGVSGLWAIDGTIVPASQ